MALAICFKCGSEKSNPFQICDACHTAPQSNDERAMSFALCRGLSSSDQLESYAHAIQTGDYFTSVPDSVVQLANETLGGQYPEATLDVYQNPKPSEDTSAESHVTTPKISAIESVAQNGQRNLHTFRIQQNPFALLGVSTRDDRRHIVALAEEMSLELDHDACQKARSELTSPRMRLSAEMDWLPGVSPRRAIQLLSTLNSHPMSIREETGLPTLAHLNLLAAAFEVVDNNDSVDDIACFIQEMAYLSLDLSADQVLRDINEDRSISGFPEIKNVDQIEAQFAVLMRCYRNAIKDALNRLTPESLVEAMVATVDGITLGGEEHAPELIDDLVDSYEVEAQGFLTKEAESIEKLIETVRSSAGAEEHLVIPILDKLMEVARNWDKVAQPIQLSSKARGIDHDQSHQIAYAIRSLAIDLFNEHDMIEQSQRLTQLIKELFAEVPEVVEQVEKDSEALQDIFQNRAQAEAQKEEFARDITYQAEVGIIFKNSLSINPEEIVWKNQRFPVDAITRVRWGAVRSSVNGISSGTTYTIAFGDGRSEAVVELKKESIYSKFLEKLWKAVCVRLLMELFETLRAGKEVFIGEATIRDDGVTLIKHKFLVHEKVSCSWSDVHYWSADGSFYIGDKADKKTYVGLSYINTANTHILEQAIQIANKKPGMRRLSDILQ